MRVWYGPDQRRRRVVLRGQDGGHREAVLGGQAGSFRQRNVRAGIALGDVDRTKQSVDLALDEHWLRSGVEEALEVAGTCRPPCLVKGRRDVVLNVRPEPILVRRHAGRVKVVREMLEAAGGVFDFGVCVLHVITFAR